MPALIIVMVQAFFYVFAARFQELFMLRFAVNSFSLSLLSAVFSLSLLSGCAAQRIADEDSVSLATTEKVGELGNDSERALSEAEAALSTAENEDLSFYAPLHMEQIQQALKQARSHDLAGHTQAAIESAARVLSLLDSALKNKARAQNALSPLFAQKAVLDDIKASSVMSAQYQRDMKELRSLIGMIEAGERSKVIDRSTDVLKSLQQLELDTMLHLHWLPASETLEKADDEDAGKYAPSTFSDAELQVENAGQMIRRHYQNRALAAETGEKALRAAQHALYIARESKAITRLDAAQAEQAALKFEGYLHQLGNTLNAGDMRHMALKDQTLAIIQHAEEQARQAAKHPAMTTPVTAQAAADAAPSEPPATPDALPPTEQVTDTKPAEPDAAANQSQAEGAPQITAEEAAENTARAIPEITSDSEQAAEGSPDAIPQADSFRP
ncbi:MAG: hypothetical protein LRY66_13075 [Saccharospirillaceae bacterium]|nr:hypothetical protein [Saccharospirillaceae bacterium]MCD8532244.1 hypothetical protein [Saccharospirillaceae bacterium]